MSLFRRAYLGIIRRPLPSIALFVAITSMSVAFVYGSFIKDVVASFYSQLESLQGIGLYVENRTATEEVKIEDSIVDELLTKEHIVGCNRTYIASCNPVDFRNVPYESQRGLTIAQETNLVTLIGNMDVSFYSTFRNEFMKLIEGNYPTATTQGILIDQNLADCNQIALNSYVTIYSNENDEAIRVKVVGIYETLQSPRKEVLNGNDASFYIESSSYIFCDIATYGRVGKVDSMEHILHIYVDEQEHLDEVHQSLSKSGLFAGDCYIANAQENELGGNSIVIATLKNSARSILLVTFFTSIAIIFLLTLLWMKKHTYEAGIYMALGIPKVKIVLTFILELWMLSLGAIVMAMIVSGFVFGENSRAIYDMVVDKDAIYITNHLLEKDVIANAFSFGTIVKSAVTSFGVATLATLWASVSIVRYKPSELLSEK